LDHPIAFLPYDRYDGRDPFAIAGSDPLADRFFCPEPPTLGRVTLQGDEARHLARVRRVEVGQVVELFDGRGANFRAEVEDLGRGHVDLRVVGPKSQARPPALTLSLASAVPKGDRFDWLVEKATELGVARLTPLTTERSVVDPRSAKLDRLRRVVVEASKQSRRDLLMELDRPIEWPALLKSAGADHRLLAHPGGRPIAGVGGFRRGESALLAIGPEGGFSDLEVEQAISAGWQAVSLGPTTLRVETAALAASALLLALAEADPEPEGEAT